LEKESGLAKHQTGHNSGVIHSGIYYQIDSLKARFAKEGGAALVTFCREHGIEFDICGKLLVASEPNDVPRLERLYSRGLQHGLNVSWLRPSQIREIEPHASGLAAVRVPSAGIIDYGHVAKTFAELVSSSGGELRLCAEVEHIEERNKTVILTTSKEDVHARLMVNCAGLQSDRIAAMSGLHVSMRIVPFRGEYYKLRPEKRHLVRNLIYPVPNPNFPFLGVHFTRTVAGEVEAGPSAVLGLAREGYRKSDINLKDLADTLGYPAFWALAGSYWRVGLQETLRSLSKRYFTRSLQKLVPAVEAGDLVAAEAGIRAQALSEDGALVDDFVMLEGKHSMHICNAPSPAATACIPIGNYVSKRAAERIGLLAA
jgi:L-2-hydroxyglutarate oxidase